MRPLPASPMVSAAASFMPEREQQQVQASPPPRAATAPSLAQDQAPTPLMASLGPVDSPLLRRLDSAGSGGAESPLARSGSWRHAAAAGAATASPASSGGSGRRRSARVTTTLTPPKRFDSPQPSSLSSQLEQQPTPQASRPPFAEGPAAAAGGGNSTPVSAVGRRSSSGDASSPHVLQPRQPTAPSSDSPLLASCFKTGPAALAASPFALLSPVAAAGSMQQQEPLASPQWASPAAGSGLMARAASSGSLDSPRSAAARRRSAVFTTSSPQAPPRSLDSPAPAVRPHRLSSGGKHAALAAAPSPVDRELLLGGPMRFDSPAVSALSSRSQQAQQPAAASDVLSLQARLARLRNP